jgi:hypothetical protein
VASFPAVITASGVTPSLAVTVAGAAPALVGFRKNATAPDFPVLALEQR